jgi:hypothetical protein
MRKRMVALSVVVVAIAAAVGAGIVVFRYYFAPRTVQSVLALYGRDARSRLARSFERAHVAYPPKRLALLVFKDERRIAVWAAGRKEPWRYIRDYTVLAASGHAGPKLREGDYQVPEGLYRIALLNPNSSYHLSMQVSYPNESDRAHASADHRTRLGGDIFIHGKNVSIGCIAIGDPAIEELFTLVADAGFQSVKVIIAPNDLRVRRPPLEPSMPSWVPELYRTIAAALADFPIWMESNGAIDVTGRMKVKSIAP